MYLIVLGIKLLRRPGKYLNIINYLTVLTTAATLVYDNGSNAQVIICVHREAAGESQHSRKRNKATSVIIFDSLALILLFLFCLFFFVIRS